MTEENDIRVRPARWPTRAILVLVGGAVAVVGAIGAILFVGDSESNMPGSTAEVQGEAAPVIQLAYLDGRQTLLSDLAGTPVVLNFFADWCPACVAEMPDFQSVHETFGDEVLFLGVDRSGSDSGARGLIDSTGITYDVAVDRDGSIFQAFGGLAMPTTVFIAADGTIVGQHNGVIFEQDLTDRINDIFFGA